MSYKVCHISATPDWRNSDANWGDKVLVYATQKRFEESLGKIDWTEMGCRKIYTLADVDEINRHEFVIVGGGGLILPDTFKNNVSGWQWGISSELMRKIRIPIIVYSIGWNLFPGQKNNDSVLRENLRSLASWSTFLSLRHSEDVRLFNEYTDMNKAVLNFCPSICIDEFRADNSKRVGINIAGDRPNIRYHNERSVFDKLLHFIYILTYNGYEPVIVNHMTLDSRFSDCVKSHQNIEIVNMSTMSVAEGVEFYRSLGYMFATRGHAQMIPMGLGVKTASLVSHKKLYRFLHDVIATDTAIDINDERLDLECANIMQKLDSYRFDLRRHRVEVDLIVNMEKIIRELKSRGVK